MDQDRANKFTQRNFSTPDLFSSHLSKIVEQANMFDNSSITGIGKMLGQYEKMTALPEIPKLSKGLLESINNNKQGIFANSGLSEAILKNQNTAENFTGIAKLSKSLLESQNSIKDVFANSRLSKGLLE